MQRLDDFVDINRVLEEAGWQPPYRNVNPKPTADGDFEFPPLPSRSREPIASPSERTKSGIPYDRWLKMTPAQRLQQAQRYQRTRQRLAQQEKLVGNISGAQTAKYPPVAPLPPEQEPANKRDSINPADAVVPKDYDAGWYVVDREDHPYPDTKPYATEAEAKEHARQIAHQAAQAAEESAGRGLQIRKNKKGRVIGRKNVNEYLARLRSLGIHHKYIPRTGISNLAPRDTTAPGWYVIGPNDQVVSGPLGDEDAAKAVALKRGEGYKAELRSEDDPDSLVAPGAGSARVLSPTESDESGYYVVDDQHPEIRLDGPFKDEIEARQGMQKVAAELAEADIRADGLTGHEADRVRKAKVNDLSFVFYNKEEEAKKKAAEQSRMGAGGLEKGSSNDRMWEYGKMREKQLEMLAAGLIDENAPADNNPTSDYLKGHPRLENLRKVFCPLILDKGEPPRTPWTIEQVAEAMLPLIDNLINKRWKGEGFDRAEAIGPALVGLMQAIINDRGKSPFPKYAEHYINIALYRAKKTGGSVGRRLRDKGWMSGGVTSLDAPTGTGETTDDVGSTIAHDTALFQKMKCPSCLGATFDPDDEGEKCTYCNGTGTFGSDKKGRPRKCSLCKGMHGTDAQGNKTPYTVVRAACPTCAGTGAIVPTTQRGSEVDIEGGFRIDPKTGEMVRKGVSVNDQTSDAANTDNDRIVERLNSAARLVERLMQEAQLSNQQRQIMGLAFGLDGSLRAKAPTEVAELLGVLQGVQKSKQLIDTTIKNCIRKLRNVIITTKDEELFDWFLEQQYPHGMNGTPALKDLKDTEGLNDWAEEERPWPTSTGGKKKDETPEEAQSRKNEKNNPWYKRKIEDLTPVEHKEQIKELLGMGVVDPQDVNDWLERTKGTLPEVERPKIHTWEQLPPEKLLPFHRLLSKALDKKVRPARGDIADPGHESYWSDQTTGQPIETAREKAKRWEEMKAKAFADKQAAWNAKGHKGQFGQGASALTQEELAALHAQFEKSKPTPAASSAALQGLASSLGVDLADVQGTGPIVDDVPSITADDIRNAVTTPMGSYDGETTEEEPESPAPVSPSVRNQRMQDKLAQLRARRAKAEEPAEVAEGCRRKLNGLIDLMEELYFNQICEEVEKGLRGEEVLELVA